MEYLKAFVIGGLICVIGQILIDKTKLTPGRILVIFVCAGAFLELFGLYKPLIEFSGAGASVPLTGFGSVLTDGVKKAVNERGFLGVITGGVTAASAGIAASLLFGFLVSVIFKSKPKK
ncbi:MAG: stage V sporulation protein AE [Clostridia bacterium]|nr:stage V sporulation protein AE [Clostridia bacterium]